MNIKDFSNVISYVDRTRELCFDIIGISDINANDLKRYEFNHKVISICETMDNLELYLDEYKE
jgi:hypothetical protein